jgi:CheY-like chemotaxis protein
MADVLVVEDNPVNQKLVGAILTRERLSFRCAEHGGIALGMLAEERFRIVIMDIMMPVMDGHAAMRAMRADPRFRHIPVIALTANNDPEEPARCLASGCTAFMTKPFRREELLAGLTRLMLPAALAAE